LQQVLRPGGFQQMSGHFISDIKGTTTKSPGQIYFNFNEKLLS
jgi:hypothetical protein